MNRLRIEGSDRGWKRPGGTGLVKWGKKGGNGVEVGGSELSIFYPTSTRQSVHGLFPSQNDLKCVLKHDNEIFSALNSK